MDLGGGGEYSRQVARTTIPESTLASLLWFLVVLVLVFQASWRSPQGSIVIMKAGGGDKDWTSKIFTPENAGPWLILLVTLAFECLAVLPRESLPPFLQELIPLVLGSQYSRPPTP